MKNLTAKHLTAKQVYDACKKHDYILFRCPSGEQVSFNGKAVEFEKRKKFNSMDARTRFASFRSCNFNEYISNKVSFIST